MMNLWFTTVPLILQTFVSFSFAGLCPPKCVCTPNVVNCENIELTNSNLSMIASFMSNDTEIVYLGRNQLTDFSLQVFVNLTSLQELELDSNKLTRVPDNKYGYVKTLKVLNIESNSVVTLNGNDFKGYGGLHALFLSNNNIASLTKEHLKYLVHLRELHLDNNHIHGVLDDTFHFNNDLHQISIVNNIITRIEPGLFDHLIYLEEVFLYENQLKYIPDFIFSTNQRLKRLELTHNRITDISKHAFANMSNIGIVDIDLSYNMMADIKVTSFEYSKDLFVDIDGNLWHCGCPFLATIQKIVHHDHIVFEGGVCLSPSALKDKPIEVSSLSPDQVGCDLCEVADCMNGADCFIDVKKNTFQCDCQLGFEGRVCEKRKTAIDSSVCGNHTCPTSQACVPVDSRSYVCICLKENGDTIVCEDKKVSGKGSTLTWVIAGVCVVVMVTAISVFVLFIRHRRNNKNKRNILIDETDDNYDL